MSIEYWNRRRSRLEKESVYGGAGVSLLYGNPLGFAFADSLLVRRIFSRLYGNIQSASLSGRKVRSFVKKYGVDMSEFEEGPFRSFNDFFIRCSN